MYREDWVTITPGEQGREALLAELQALAEHPGHIRTAGGAQEFIVPPYLAALYMPPARKRRSRATKEEGDS